MKPLQILLIAEKSLVKSYERILGDEFILNTVHDISDAFDNLEKTEYDLFLMDMGLTKEKNLNFLRKIHAYLPSLPILLIIDEFDEEILLKAFEYGAQDYITKGEFTEKSLKRSIFNTILKKGILLKLRRKAENYIENERSIENGISSSEIPKNFTEAMHELQVSRIELEMQNEELRKTWTKLEEAREKFQDLYNLAPVGYFSLDEKGIILNVNLTGASLLNTERKSLIDKAFILFLDHDSRRKFHKHLQKLFETGLRQISQLKIVKRGMEEEKFDAQLETIPVYEENGNFKELRTILTDISEQKKAELSTAKLAAIVKSSDDAIIGMDLDGKILTWNSGAQNMYGYKAPEIIGKSIDILTPDGSIDRIIAVLNTIKHGQIIKNHHSKRLTKDGEKIDVSLTLSPVYDKNHEIVGVSSITRDITDIKNTEMELEKYRENLEEQVVERTTELESANLRLKNMIKAHEQTEKKLSKLVVELKCSNEELEQFAYIASHDLQEPLRMVSSFTQLLERQYNDKLDENAHEYIQFAVDGAKRMQNLINDLLTYSRITTTGGKFTKVDVGDVVNQALFNLEITIEENDAEVKVDELPEIYGDKFQLVQLFQNIIGNAIKYRSKEHPVINISAYEENNEWIFVVKDNGIGISAEYYERIFQIFQRLHENHIYSGTGVGLAICKKILERHGGRIWVKSKEGEGSSFYFSIPQVNFNES